LWLRGDGRGSFHVVSGIESGIRLHGEQRGAAAADFDNDGKLDWCVGEFRGTIHLFRNTRARPGLRVRLAGPSGNPRGIGAVVRLGSKAGWGPAREIHGGSGWCSQDSAVTVMALASEPSLIRVRWPGGREIETSLTSGAREVLVRADGGLQVLVP